MKMSYQRAIDMIKVVIKFRHNHKWIESTTPPPSHLEERMRRFEEGLELGRGDLKRYGMILESTSDEIVESIADIARSGHTVVAYECANHYRTLELEVNQLSLRLS